MENDLLQGRKTTFQRGLAILVPEELGVRQARPQHTFVAADDGLAAVARNGVGNDDEAARKRAVLSGRDEVAQMGAHRDDQHLGRHVHEFSVDRAEQRHRPFDEPGHFVGQTVVGFEGNLGRRAQLLRAIENDLPAFGGIEDHMRRA